MKKTVFIGLLVVVVGLFAWFRARDKERHEPEATCHGVGIDPQNGAAFDATDLCGKIERGLANWNEHQAHEKCSLDGWTVAVEPCEERCLKQYNAPGSYCFGGWCWNGMVQPDSRRILVGAGPPSGDLEHEILHACYALWVGVGIKHGYHQQHVYFDEQGMEGGAKGRTDRGPDEAADASVAPLTAD